MEGDISFKQRQHQQVVSHETVLQLVQQLYHSNQPDVQARASEQLMAIQSSHFAWDVCWPLLDPTKEYPYEARFHAANSLVLMINQKWSELDESWLKDYLRPKLIESIILYASNPTCNRLVIERLSLALATFALHSLSSFWPEAIQDILNTFQPQNLPVAIPPKSICDILLKILLFIPEEYAALIVAKNSRAKLNGQVLAAAPIVFDFIKTLLITDQSIVDNESKRNVLKCCSSWTQHSGSSLLELDNGLNFIDIIYTIIESVNNDELCTVACSALAATFSDRKAENFQNTVIDFIPKIANLSKSIEGYISREEDDCIKSTYSLVVNFSENHSQLYLKICLDQLQHIPETKLTLTKESIFVIMKTILKCTATKGTFGIDEKISEISFSFWFSFFESISYYMDKFENAICKQFSPLVDSVFEILLDKVQYPPSMGSTWTDDQQEAFRCYRQDISDVLSVIIGFPKSQERFLSILLNRLELELTHLKDHINQQSFSPWQSLEAVLFCLNAMSENLSYDERKFMPTIMDKLNEIPFGETNPLLYCSAAEMLPAFSDWIYNNEKYLRTALHILLLGINSQDPRARMASTLALKDLTYECQPKLSQYSVNIIASCMSSVHPNSNLTTNEKSRIMSAIGSAVAVLPFNEAMQSLDAVLTPIMKELADNVGLDQNLHRAARSVIINRMSILSNLTESMRMKFTNLELDDENGEYKNDENEYKIVMEDSTKQPALHLLQQLIPLMNQIALKYRNDEQVIEQIGSYIKKSAKTLQTDIKPLAKDLLALIVNSYEPLINSSLLDYSNPIYLLFKMDKDLVSFLKESFAAISNKTLDVCRTHPLRDMPVPLENYFRYATQMTKKLSNLLVPDPAIPINTEIIYKCALASLELPERRTLVEVCSFLVIFVTKSFGVESMNQIIMSNFNDLIIRLFNAIGGIYSTPRNAIDHIGEVFWVLIDPFRRQLNEILPLIIEKEDFPTKYISREQKAQIVNRLLHERGRKKVKDLCNEFCMVSRNLKRA